MTEPVAEKTFSEAEHIANLEAGFASIFFIPHEERTPDIYLAAIKKNGQQLEFVPDSMKTPEMCLLAVKRNGLALQFVPDDKRTPDICLAAVQNYGFALQFVPDHLKTLELCLMAVQKVGYALRYVPDNLKTPEVCSAAAHNNVQLLDETIRNELKLQREDTANSQDIRGIEGGSSYMVFDSDAFANDELLFADKPFGPV
jgi:hypothetical protein